MPSTMRIQTPSRDYLKLGVSQPWQRWLPPLVDMVTMQTVHVDWGCQSWFFKLFPQTPHTFGRSLNVDLTRGSHITWVERGCSRIQQPFMQDITKIKAHTLGAAVRWQVNHCYKFGLDRRVPQNKAPVDSIDRRISILFWFGIATSKITQIIHQLWSA